MRTLRIFTLIMLVALFTVSASAKPDLGLKSIGAKIGYVMPEDPWDGAIGFGVQANLGTITTDLALDGFVEYWSSGYDTPYTFDVSLSEFIIGGTVKYFFNIKPNIKPYVGSGLAIHFVSVDVGFGSGSETDIGIPILGGIELPLSDQFNGFGELKYAITDLSYFGIFVGVNYVLGK